MVDGKHSTRRAVKKGEVALVSKTDAETATSPKPKRSDTVQSGRVGKAKKPATSVGASKSPKKKKAKASKKKGKAQAVAVAAAADAPAPAPQLVPNAPQDGPPQPDISKPCAKSQSQGQGESATQPPATNTASTSNYQPPTAASATAGTPAALSLADRELLRAKLRNELLATVAERASPQAVPLPAASTATANSAAEGEKAAPACSAAAARATKAAAPKYSLTAPDPYRPTSPNSGPRGLASAHPTLPPDSRNGPTYDPTSPRHDGTATMAPPLGGYRPFGNFLFPDSDPTSPNYTDAKKKYSPTTPATGNTEARPRDDPTSPEYMAQDDAGGYSPSLFGEDGDDAAAAEQVSPPGLALPELLAHVKWDEASQKIIDAMADEQADSALGPGMSSPGGLERATADAMMQESQRAELAAASPDLQELARPLEDQSDYGEEGAGDL
ncbi:hypothetical protein LTR53_010405 [Teratosphaeriaceae sp. CCFEE 6253]|nr:hypothetical protein LTR53_010405 [Teratosphaeriaceae sp. CCFEE 6253]